MVSQKPSLRIGFSGLKGYLYGSIVLDSCSIGVSTPLRLWRGKHPFDSDQEGIQLNDYYIAQMVRESD